ncbi:hypothetical protein [Rubrivirga marina]|uniref:Lipoprotein n=1 Tax=Rubrivirga marina TaxID=1196024 RepID=A0A271J3Q0_9BACT|nr:hypothetical protein [Rubrivirga marina]PAP78132.1 hypothetical protein BSZ37_17670 [Rubrivirga marina]
MRFVYALVLAVVLSGCFHIDSLLTVRPDGSATLRDEVTLSGMALMALMETEDDEGSPFDEAAMEARAEALGEGVRVASFEPREDGYTVVFDVDDVRQLRYATPEALGENEGEGPDGVDLSFGFDEGDPSTLRVLVPKPEPDDDKVEASDAAPEVDPQEQARMLAMMRSFFADARMTVAVEVEGAIEETNASYVDGSRVTLFDLPFVAVFDVMEANPELMGNEPPEPEAMLDELRAIEGVRMEGPGTVRVRFR